MSTTSPGDQPSGTMGGATTGGGGGATSYGGGGGEGGRGYGQPGLTLDFARLPIPGNAEFLYALAALILLALIAAISDAYDVRGWVTAFTAISVAYLISRGIAKASRVLEH